MIVRNLPPPAIFTASGHPLVFADHLLLTGTTETPYFLPEQVSGMGLLLLLSGSGSCRVNRQRESLHPGKFLLINRGSRLAITLPHPGAQPLFLFFHTALAAELEARKGVDWRWLERVHPLPPHLRLRLEWLITAGNYRPSFCALNAPRIAPRVTEQLIN